MTILPLVFSPQVCPSRVKIPEKIWPTSQLINKLALFFINQLYMFLMMLALSWNFSRTIKTLEFLSRSFGWPGIRKFVSRYVTHCQVCIRAKPCRQQASGHLLPLSIPERPWSSISMDFITGLPSSNNHNSILVVVDRLTKMSHFIACSDTVSSEELATLFLTHIFRLHGLPKNIISDRGAVFTSKFWEEFMKQLRVQTSLSTAFHWGLKRRRSFPIGSA